MKQVENQLTNLLRGHHASSHLYYWHSSALDSQYFHIIFSLLRCLLILWLSQTYESVEASMGRVLIALKDMIPWDEESRRPRSPSCFPDVPVLIAQCDCNVQYIITICARLIHYIVKAQIRWLWWYSRIHWRHTPDRIRLRSLNSPYKTPTIYCTILTDCSCHVTGYLTCSRDI